MTSTRRIALAELTAGWLLARHPAPALHVLGYPHDGPLPRAVIRTLGLRRLLQGSLVWHGGRSALRMGAGIDAVHALTCLAYARRSRTGRRAGLVSGSAAVGFAGLQLWAAAPRGRPRDDPDPAGRPLGREVAATPSQPWVASVDAAVWPEPDPEHQIVRVGAAQQVLVELQGGVMDGATVAVDPDTRCYDVIDSDRGPQRYEDSGQRSDVGRRVFTRQADEEP